MDGSSKNVCNMDCLNCVFGEDCINDADATEEEHETISEFAGLTKKEQEAEKRRQWYKENRELQLERNRKSRAKNPDYRRNYYLAHREHEIASAIARRKAKKLKEQDGKL